jgi:hypothetical protein
MATLVEAVIISGPRKGEFVRLDPDSLSAAPELEAAVEELIVLGRQIAANLAAATSEANEMREQLRGSACWIGKETT